MNGPKEAPSNAWGLRGAHGVVRAVGLAHSVVVCFGHAAFHERPGGTPPLRTPQDMQGSFLTGPRLKAQ